MVWLGEKSGEYSVRSGYREARKAWLIWTQRNAIIHGKQLLAHNVLNKREEDYMEEFRSAQSRLATNSLSLNQISWRPPPLTCFKLNFDATIFKDEEASGIGAIIRNDRGEVMVAFSSKGPLVSCSKEAEILACWCVVEFALVCGFMEMVVEGDNQLIMSPLELKRSLKSRVGHIIQDVLCFLHGFRWSQVQFAKRSANTVVHLLARHAKNLVHDVIWMEESPPPMMQALYHDAISI
ncbi:uncharacterized protein LOC142621618 [Castanea sativa]|uniref:uncharacterized protein LOC142621618 n=1 Tax=Castanea sativa TaxID=21020 RepID=UPI003F650EAF